MAEDAAAIDGAVPHLQFPFMHPLVAAFGVLLFVPTAAAAGQVHVNVDVGVLLSTRLVRDSIVAPLSVTPDPALTAGARVTTDLEGAWRMGVLGRVGRSDLEVREADTDTSLTTLTVWHLGALLSRHFTDRASADVTIGILFYRPSLRRANLFQGGEPRPLVWGVGVQYEHPVSRRIWAGLRLGYDGHRFGTETLRANGFRDKRFVHRVFIGVTLGWHGEAPEQP
jgi:hypothetical protein